jgi:2-polyprenyl-6-methoxyphenol hydroxylase-like FAD-dependent oxidoreductase
MTARSPETVVVVGAGPVGLVAACELLRFGVQVRVLEAEAAPRQGSRAILLWPPTLRVLRDLGVLDEAEQRGIRARSMSYRLPGGRVLRVVLGADNEPLMLAQAQTEELLEVALEKLGGKVERSAEVTAVTARPDGCTLTVHRPGGDETVEADWLIGADGLRSAVRAGLGVEYPGRQFPGTYLVAEGRLDGPYRKDELAYFFSPTGALLLAPLADGLIRFGGAVAEGPDLTEQGLQTILDQRGPGGLRVHDVTLLDTFASQERMAAALHGGRWFLVGDAAHTHPAVGGQGLNLGIQDAHNLVWKLAGVLDGRYPPAVLGTYEPERRQAIEQTMRTTHLLAKLIVAGPWVSRVRNTLWRGLQATGVLRRWYAPLLAGRRTGYRGGLPTAGAQAPGRDRPSGRAAALRRGGALPRPGAPAPLWAPEPGDGRPGGFRLLVTGGSDGRLAAAGREFAHRYQDLVTYEQVARRGRGFLLLRPDGYVAAAGTGPAELARTEENLRALLAPRP